MHEKYHLSPEMEQFVAHCESYFAEDVITRGIEGQRKAYNAMTQSFARERPASMLISDQKIDGVDTRSYSLQPDSPSPAEESNNATTILYAHGGGWYLGGLNSHDNFCAYLAKKCQVKVIAIDYSLAPLRPYPAGLNDCHQVYKTLVEQGINPILMGDSAGANLMAALTLRCKEEALVQARAQILIYPALAPPLSLPSHTLFADAPLLSSSSIKFCFQTYVPHCYSTQHNPAIFPLHASSLESLPPAIIFGAQHDALIDDAKQYAVRLQEDGVEANCIIIKGIVHGALHAIGESKEAEDLFDSICEQVIRLK